MEIREKEKFYCTHSRERTHPMEFIITNQEPLNELVGSVSTLFSSNPYVKQQKANSLWIIVEIQKQFLNSKKLYTDYMNLPKNLRPDIIFEIIFLVLAHPSVHNLFPETQHDELQLLIQNKTNIKILFDTLFWTFDKNQDGILSSDEIKCACDWSTCFGWKQKN